MSGLSYYRHSISRYTTETTGISMLQHGAYRLLRDAYIGTGKPLPVDRYELYRIAFALRPEEQAAVDEVVARFFQVDGNVLRHPECDAEIERVQAESARQAAKGRRSWHSRQVTAEAEQPAVDAGSITTAITAEDTVDITAAHATAEATVKPQQPNFQTAVQPKSCLKSRSRSKTTPPIVPPLIPDWIPRTAWNAYLAMRQRIRKPMTDHAIELAIGKLADLRNAGFEPQAVLDQSTFHSWQGLFPLRGDFATNRREQIEQQNHDLAERWANGGN